MGFGLKNVAQSFQRFIHYFLSGLSFIFSYIDDVLVSLSGHTINSDGISPLAERVAAMSDYKLPETKPDLRRFLSMLNFYRKFVRGAAGQLIPLNKFLEGANKRDKTVINWTDDSRQPF